MAILICPNCPKTFTSQRDLQKHLERKYPCDGGRFVCEHCTQTFSQRSSRDRHRKYNCKGMNPVVVPQLQEARLRIQELEDRLAEVTQKLAQAAQEEAEAEDEVPAEEPVSDEPMWIKPADFQIATVIECDAEQPQVYFFLPGDLLKPLVKTYGVPVKTGSSDTIYNRALTHARDFGGGKLIDSVKTTNPKLVESRFKRWMKVTARFVECKTSKKPGVEQEVFAAHNQEDYAMIVKKAREFAEEYESTVQTQSDLLKQLKAALETLAPAAGLETV